MPENNDWIIVDDLQPDIRDDVIDAVRLQNAAIKAQIRDVLNKQAKKAIQKPFKIIWGGADVDPSVYNRPISGMCGWTNVDRDNRDLKAIQEAWDNKQIVIGICRGSQILNVANGGILVQHIENHSRSHTVLVDKAYTFTDESKKAMSVTSTHHQMMIPTKDGIILAKDHNPTIGKHWDNVDEDVKYPYVNEVIWYPETKSLCIQPHPEWMEQDSPFVQWINAFLAFECGARWEIDFKDEEQAEGEF